MVKGRTTYSSDEDKEVRELLKNDQASEAEKQRLIEQGAAEVRSKWTVKREREAARRTNDPYELPWIRDSELGLDESPGAER